MRKFFGKKQVVIGTLIVALGVAVYLNYYLTDSSIGTPDTNPPTTQSKPSDNELGEALNVNSDKVETSYFEQARENREKSRDEAVDLVKEVLDNVKADDEQKQAAATAIAVMAKAIEQESCIEDLIKAKGFADCVVYIEGDQCSVVVKSDDLTVQDTSKISQIVTAQSNILPQNINIVPMK
ncbi:MAG: SpoIIIAH-like family protein [Clostridia bacterium]|nr:SpoIIIAH-like family protein [Clostridia bacterium]